MWTAQDVKENLKSKHSPYTLRLFGSSLLVMVCLLLSRNSVLVHSQIYMVFMNWRKYVQCPKCFISLHHFKQHTRCDQKTQYSSEKSSGRRSPERGLCSTVEILSRWPRAATHGLDEGSAGICICSSWAADGLWLPPWSRSCGSIFHFSFTQWTRSAHTVCNRLVS